MARQMLCSFVIAMCAFLLSGCGKISSMHAPCIPDVHDDSISQEMVREMRRMTPAPKLQVRGAVRPLSALPALNSQPGASASLHLLFTGTTVDVWRYIYKNIVIPPFDKDGDSSTFSDDEIAAIRDIWSRVAEHYAPMNLNVTTVEPANRATTLRVMIGGDGAWYDHAAGGVASTNAYRNPTPAQKVAFTFPIVLQNNNKFIADAITHEAGHAFGLGHQAVYDASGTLTSEYHRGGNGIVPLMGVPYYLQSLWWNGPAGSATNFQNDLEVVANVYNGFGYRSDDFANTYDEGVVLKDTDGVVSGTGVIERVTDVDVLPFSSGSGVADLVLNVDPARTGLDLKVDLKSASGTVLASAMPNAQGQIRFQPTLSNGYYYIVARSASAGAAQAQYVGQYRFSLTFPAGGPGAKGTPSAPLPPVASESSGELSASPEVCVVSP